MKKLMIALLAVMVTVAVFGQQINLNGDVAYYSKNLSTFTGLEFSEQSAVVTHVRGGFDYKKIGLSCTYTGQHAIEGNKFNLLDLAANYKLNGELEISAGVEFTYQDEVEGKDAFGKGVFAMANYSKNRVSANCIYFSDPKMVNRYYIGSVDLQVGKNVSLYTLAGYTNTKDKPIYGLVGVKCTKGDVFVGTYWVFDGDNPGPVVALGLTF